MNKLLMVASLLILNITSAKAQYYYKDIITNEQVLADMNSYKTNKIRTVKLKSFEDDNSPSEGFFCERKISKDYKKSDLFTKTNISGASVFTSFFSDKGRILKTLDSSDISSSTTVFEYDDNDRIIKITSIIRSSDDDFINEIKEEHIYTWGNAGPTKMALVKNGYDTTFILFMADDKNNVSIEKNSKTGRKYYYYYDDKNRLTDIVHANERTERLLPDYMFEYNAAGLLTQMTSTEEGGNYYYIWRYAYENGMRTKERCYSKDKRLMGSIEYEYK